MKVAIIRGPFFRPNSTLHWEYVHTHYEDVDVTGFNSRPRWHDPSELDLPIEDLDWIDGKLDAFGHENVLYRALEHYKLPSIALTGLREIVREYDVVHVTENFRLYSWYAGVLCSRTDTDFFVDVHENIPHRPANPITWLLKRGVNERADGFTTSTTAGKRALIHEGVDAENIELLPNVLEFEHFDRGPRNAAVADLPERLEEAFNVLFVHGLSEQKGTHYLVDAFENLQQSYDDVNLVLVGQSDLEDAYYREHVRDNASIHHVEYIPNHEIRHLYNLSDVFVLPSITVERNEEQFGFSVLEAMACGVPSIVTDVGGLPFVVEEGVTSLVIEERSADAIADAIARLHEDKQLRRELGDNAYEYVREHYTVETVSDRLYELYTRDEY